MSKAKIVDKPLEKIQSWSKLPKTNGGQLGLFIITIPIIVVYIIVLFFPWVFLNFLDFVDWCREDAAIR